MPTGGSPELVRLDRREAESEVSEPGRAEQPASPRLDRGLDPSSLLALQRSLGNVGVARLLARQPATLEEPPTADKPYLAWTKDEVRPIQKELRRMRLYNLGVDGILGKISDQGLVEAFGGDEWRTMDAAGVLERLKAAERPKPKGAKGGDFRYGELFKDG